MTDFAPLAVPAVPDTPEACDLTPCEGGVCAAAGIRAAGVSAGFRRNPARLDLALVVADDPCVAAATFTTNRFCAAPVTVSRAHVADGRARAIVLNSGNANAATGEPGLACAERACAYVADELGCAANDVLVASTGVIGVQLPFAPYEAGVPAAVASLAATSAAAHDAACAVMTTDTVPKEVSVAGELTQRDGGSRPFHVGGFVKGSGMIQPNMATMLAVLATDAPLTAEAAHEALLSAVRVSFNKVTVDSDTSTNDSAFLLATGAAGGEEIDLDHPAYPQAATAIRVAAVDLARKIAADGEGSTKLVTVTVTGAASEADADTVARAVANSPLVKTAVFGHDANWGRVAAAAGKCGVPFDQTCVDIDFMGVPVCRAGLTVPMDEEDMLRRFEAPEIAITVDLGMGDAATRVWTCDLTHDYVTINGDYRT
ncbi:bifunctional ornithine acetyltransferase/N-acetylglutamate synthase [Olsenella sp. An285]|uniref:bifunctional glutamate N-acetyltransferase/amino-acid acetyltransferase ArgJ n=1 Tax=Olsenella sp. An285 TaxID=1965621 RepID=UPI000B395D36|nr:bifunctional glutamate N-acetyltransferase/amino-acid acetyltransferase ArgJ [Olsenella sp. An285]OUO46299.1 bifunctional ornithine acetyltransferase/N-acetylglutamate synthase [Olsenella sp. An285]